jgi:hypothetical protein
MVYVVMAMLVGTQKALDPIKNPGLFAKMAVYLNAHDQPASGSFQKK